MPNSFISTSCTCVIRCDADFQRYLRFCHIKSCITKFKMIPVGYFELFHQCRITNVLVDNASMTIRCISWQAYDEWRSTIVSMLKDAILCNHVITVMPSWHPKLPETWLFIYQLLQANNSKTVKVPQWLVYSPHKGPVIWQALPCHDLIIWSIFSKIHLTACLEFNIVFDVHSDVMKFDVFLHDLQCTWPWIKVIFNELDFTFHMTKSLMFRCIKLKIFHRLS